MRQALDYSYAYRIANADEYDGNGRGLTFGCLGGGRAGRHQNPGTPPQQLNHSWIIVWFIPYPFQINRDIPTFD